MVTGLSNQGASMGTTDSNCGYGMGWHACHPRNSCQAHHISAVQGRRSDGCFYEGGQSRGGLLASGKESFPLGLVPSGNAGPCALSFGTGSIFPGMLSWGVVVLPRLQLPPAWLSWPQSWSPSVSSAAPSRRSLSSVVECGQCPLVTPPSPSAGLLGAEQPGWCLHFPWPSGAAPSWGPFLPAPRRTGLGESGLKGHLGPGWWSWWPGLGGSG